MNRANNWEGRRILVVDDSKVVRDSVSRIYTEAGLSVCGEVENGVLALEFLEKNQVDLLSLDVIMPEMNGIDCLRRVTSMGLPLQTIFLSCLFDDRRVVARLQEEFPEVAFLSKPLTWEGLEQARQYLSGAGRVGMSLSA